MVRRITGVNVVLEDFHESEKNCEETCNDNM